jgi:TonB family protein
MKRSFAVPVAISLSAHVFFLFGFSKPAPVQVIKPPAQPTTMDSPTVPTDLVDEQANENSGNPGKQPSKSSDEPVPGEPPSVRFDRPSISISVPQGTDSMRPFVDSPKFGHGGTLIIDPASHLDRVPQLVSSAAPTYPYQAKHQRIEGRVLIEFTVDTQGQVMTARIISSDNAIFDEPTLQAVYHWKFEPGLCKGVAVPFRMRLPVNFALEN